MCTCVLPHLCFCFFISLFKSLFVKYMQLVCIFYFAAQFFWTKQSVVKKSVNTRKRSLNKGVQAWQMLRAEVKLLLLSQEKILFTVLKVKWAHICFHKFKNTTLKCELCINPSQNDKGYHKYMCVRARVCASMSVCAHACVSVRRTVVTF